MKNFKKLHIAAAVAGLAAIGAASAAAAAFGVDVAHLASLDWNGIASGLLLANAPIAIAEQIKLFEAKRTAAQEAASELVNKSVEEGRSLDEHERETHATLAAEIKTIDEHVKLLKEHEALMVNKAVTPPRDAGTNDGGNDNGGALPGRTGSITVKSNLPAGVRFTRFALAMAQAKGNVMLAHALASERFKDTPEVANCLKAAISMGGTPELARASVEVQKAAVTSVNSTDSAVTQYTDMENEFIELLRPKQIMGRMQSLNRVPFLMRAGRQLTGVTGSFVGEGAPKPVNKQTYDNVTLGFAKVAVIVVLSEEAVRFSTIRAEMRARDDMVKGVATYIDKRFMDPSYSGVANVSPASITNGAVRYQSSGSTLAAIDTDVKAAFAMFAASDVDPSTAVWVMPASVALRLSMKRNTNDEPAFPTLSMMGGTWYGLPVIVSNAMVAAGSPAELQIALVTQEEVFLADEGGISIDMSTEASVQMNDAPSAGAQSLVSLWQNNLIGIRAEQFINWAPRRANNLGIALIENTNY